MKTVMTVVFGILVGVHVAYCKAAATPKVLTLVVGNPVSEKFIKPLASKNGDLVIAGEFKVELRNVHIIAGTADVPSKLSLELIGSDSGVFVSNKEIFVLLRNQAVASKL